MVRGLYGIYEQYKEKSFPKLLKDLTIPNEEKRKIEDLLRKPWNLYIISALQSYTKKQILERIYFKTTRRLVVTFTDAPQIYALFWQ